MTVCCGYENLIWKDFNHYNKNDNNMLFACRLVDHMQMILLNVWHVLIIKPFLNNWIYNGYNGMFN